MLDFTIHPQSKSVGPGEEAVFQCQYPGASINWRINGSSNVTSTESSVSSSGGQASDTLTIIALLEYNATEVVCIALLSDLSLRQSVPVYLTIDGEFILQAKHVTFRHLYC